MEWRTVVVTVLVISLGFLAIPIRVPASVASQSDEDVHLFMSYVKQYNKSYRHDPKEFEKRFERFQRSLRQIEGLNSQRLTQESAYYGLTQFSDLSEEEFLDLTLRRELSKLGEQHKNDVHHRRKHHSHRIKRLAGVPVKLDWRTKGIITGVRSQGSCGACWAYSTVECIESMIAIKNGTLRSLSVQEMIDCAGNGNFGCNGGDICSLLSWLVDYDVPILMEASYPVTGTSATCKLDRTASSTIRVADFTCDSYVDSEEDLVTTIATHGPVAAAVNALTWQNYLGGIIQFHCDGAFSMLNHAVQIVGYDKSGPIPYYIVRNSWGPLFGNKGYLYIAIGSNICGIANQVAAVDATW